MSKQIVATANGSTQRRWGAQGVRIAPPRRTPSKDDPKTLALQTFERWSNYLLVTTVAATGWIASKNLEISPTMKNASLWCFGVSIVFGILTLALEIFNGGRYGPC